MKIVAPMTALLVVVLSVPVVGQESTRQDFEDFCKAFDGRWVCDTTLVEDAPGVGEKGDKFTEYADCKVAHDGNAMICKTYGGKGCATWIVVYDAGDKQIKSLWVASGGDVGHGTIYKQGEKWIEASRGSQADGTKQEVTFTVTITDNGNTHTWAGTPVTGGKKAAEYIRKWHRVNK